MNAIELILRLHQHRAWVNKNLLVACAALGEAPLRRSFAIGQGSIWRTLVHLYAAEFVWLEALLGNDDPVAPGDRRGEIPGNQQGEQPFQSFTELQDRWSELERRWDDYLRRLKTEQLDEIVYKRSASAGAGARLGTRRGDILLHVVTHAQYTTAQLMNMLRQSGVAKLPDVMLIAMARQEAVRQADNATDR